jgi:coenzyme F420-0:L-glutamate ligase / coenzyme F420-1:gamma-L-glutamate ligase
VLTAFALAGIPEVTPGFDLAATIVDVLASGNQPADRDAGPGGLQPGDVIAVAHKVISKQEGRVRRLADVIPGPEALRIAASQEKDPRQVQVVLDESVAIVREGPGVLVVETRHGFVCANAGVDASNVGDGESVLMLPLDPDASAQALRWRLRELTGIAPAVVISDSFGRAWRVGQTDVAVGVAGLAPVEDWRGSDDAYGRQMNATVIAVADLVAATADLARRKDGQQPVVLIRGLERLVTIDDGPGAAALLRDRDQDLFR